MIYGFFEAPHFKKKLANWKDTNNKQRNSDHLLKMEYYEFHKSDFFFLTRYHTPKWDKTNLSIADRMEPIPTESS